MTHESVSALPRMEELHGARPVLRKRPINSGSTVRLFFLIPFTALLWSLGYPEVIRLPIYLWLVPALVIPARWGRSLLGSLSRTYILIALLGSVLLVIHISSSVFWTIGLLLWVCTVYVCLVERMRLARHRLDDLLGIFDAGLIWSMRVNVAAILASLWLDGSLLHRGSGFFIEPSHLGYTLGPVLAYLLFKRNYRIEAGVSAVALLAVAPSSTFAIAIGLGLILGLGSTRLVLALLVVAIGLAAAGGLMLLSAYMLEIKPESTAVWIAAFQTADEQMSISPIFGNGPFSWLLAGEREIDYQDLSTLNQRDLASLLPFIVASFGWAGVILLLIAILALLRRTRRDSKLALLTLVCTLTFLARWAGPVPSAFLPLVVVFLAFERFSK